MLGLSRVFKDIDGSMMVNFMKLLSFKCLQMQERILVPLPRLVKHANNYIAVDISAGPFLGTLRAPQIDVAIQTEACRLPRSESAVVRQVRGVRLVTILCERLVAAQVCRCIIIDVNSVIACLLEPDGLPGERTLTTVQLGYLLCRRP